MQFLNRTKYRDTLYEFVRIILFGILSLMLNKVKFIVPGAEGMLSDMRSLPLIISVFYLRRWYSIFVLSFFTGFGLFEGGSFGATYFIHAIVLTYLFFVYKHLNKSYSNHKIIIVLWLVIMLFYFYVLLYPLMICFSWILGKVEPAHFIEKYFDIAFEIRFEMILTTLISMLYLMYITANQKLQKQNSELYHSMKKAKENEQLKTAFLQNLSHEIRTPMNGIHGFSRLLMDNYESAEQVNNYCKNILRCSDQLLNIVNDIIDISQIETGQLNLTKSSKPVVELISDVTNTLLINTSYDLERLLINLDEKTNKKISTDFYKINRILYHLVDNALKFSKDKPVRISFDISESQLYFSVKDEGIGIDEKDRKNIFRKFQQVEGDLTRRYSGNGLGLSIVHGFITKLNGVYNFESTEGKGTTFNVTIPL